MIVIMTYEQMIEEGHLLPPTLKALFNPAVNGVYQIFPNKAERSIVYISQGKQYFSADEWFASLSEEDQTTALFKLDLWA